MLLLEKTLGIIHQYKISKCKPLIIYSPSNWQFNDNSTVSSSKLGWCDVIHLFAVQRLRNFIELFCGPFTHSFKLWLLHNRPIPRLSQHLDIFLQEKDIQFAFIHHSEYFPSHHLLQCVRNNFLEYMQNLCKFYKRWKYKWIERGENKEKEGISFL
jgi:hypothetical protein